MDWSAAADLEATLAIYMGRDCAAAISARLIAGGRPPSTPALAVESAGGPGARLTQGSLADLALLAAGEGGPTLFVIGEVAALAQFPAMAQDLMPASRAVG